MDCYAVLEVEPAASTAAIRAAYRRLVQRWHPDKNPEARAEATLRMSEINLAWEILQDEQSRRMYDEARASGSQWIPTGKRGEGIRRSTRMHADAPLMLEVDSGCVRSVGHDGLSKLFIEFRSGGLYVYRGVARETYAALLRSESQGRFVIFNIISGPYLCQRIGA